MLAHVITCGSARGPLGSDGDGSVYLSLSDLYTDILTGLAHSSIGLHHCLSDHRKPNNQSWEGIIADNK